MIHPVFMEKFLDFIEKEKFPLDFFSWHTYSDNIQAIAKNATLVRKMLDERGLLETDSHLSEWNYMQVKGVGVDIWSPNEAEFRRGVFERCKNEEGASFAAATLLLLQDLPVDVANYYDGQPTALFCGIFDYYGVPKKIYYAFKAFKQLYDMGQKVEIQDCQSEQGIYCCAGVKEDKSEAVIMISNFHDQNRVCSLDVRGLQGTGKYMVQEYILDRERDLKLSSSQMLGGKEFILKSNLEKYSVALVKIIRE